MVSKRSCVLKCLSGRITGLWIPPTTHGGRYMGPRMGLFKLQNLYEPRHHPWGPMVFSLPSGKLGPIGLIGPAWAAPRLGTEESNGLAAARRSRPAIADRRNVGCL